MVDAQMTKPSIEQSQRIFWQSLIIFFFGLMVSVTWYLLWMSTALSLSDSLVFSGCTLLEAILTILIGLRHLRKYREYVRVNLEIEEGLSDIVSAE